MTWVDGVALLIIGLSGLLALARGLVREILGLGAWIGAGLAAFEYYPEVETQLSDYVHQPKLILPLSIGLIFVVVLIVLSIVSTWLGSMVRDSVLSGIDRTLGLAFGLVRGAVIVCLLYVGLSIFLPPLQWPAGVTNAKLLPYAENGSQVLVALLPAAYQPHLDHDAGGSVPEEQTPAAPKTGLPIPAVTENGANR